MGVFWKQFQEISRIILSHGPSASEEARGLTTGGLVRNPRAGLRDARKMPQQFTD
jgi:hypothetical protein